MKKINSNTTGLRAENSRDIFKRHVKLASSLSEMTLLLCKRNNDMRFKVFFCSGPSSDVRCRQHTYSHTSYLNLRIQVHTPHRAAMKSHTCTNIFSSLTLTNVTYLNRTINSARISNNMCNLVLRADIKVPSEQCINLLKHTVYVMHQQFNIQQLYALPTLYLCVLYLSENKQRLVPLTA